MKAQDIGLSESAGKMPRTDRSVGIVGWRNRTNLEVRFEV